MGISMEIKDRNDVVVRDSEPIRLLEAPRALSSILSVYYKCTAVSRKVVGKSARDNPERYRVPK